MLLAKLIVTFWQRSTQSGRGEIFIYIEQKTRLYTAKNSAIYGIMGAKNG